MKIYSNLLIFSVKTVQQNLSKCNKKTTGNIYYILTEFEEKNTTEVAQLMQQNVAYSNSQSNIQNHVIISLSLRLFSDFRLSQRKLKH